MWTGEGDSPSTSGAPLSPAPAAPGTQAAPAGSPLAQVAQSAVPGGPIPGLVQKWATAEDSRADTAKQAAESMGRRVDTAQQGITNFVDEAQKRAGVVAEHRPDITTPPNLQARPFLAPVDGEAPEATIGKFIQAAGLFAAGVGGLARGDARGAMSAMIGAMRGWQDGDVERAGRDLADWKTKTDASLKKWNLERQSYEDWFKAGNLTVQSMLQGLSLEALKNDSMAAYKAIEAAGPFGLLQFMSKQDEFAQKMAVEVAKVVTHKEIADAQNKIAQAQLAETSRHNSITQAGQQLTNTTANRGLDIREQELADKRDERIEVRDTKPKFAPAGGAFYDTQTKQMLTSVAEGDLRKEPTRFKQLDPKESELVKFIDTTPAMINRLRELVPQILAQYPGQNLVQSMTLAAEGKLAASPELREMVSLNRALTVEGARILGSGGQLRVTLMKALEKEVGTRTSDTISTADRALQTMATDFANRRSTLLGEKPVAYGGVIGPGVWKVTDKKTGQTGTLRVGAGERISADDYTIGAYQGLK